MKAGFDHYQVLLPSDEPVVAYISNFKGKDYFHIRKLFEGRNGQLTPGKGLAIPVDQKDQLIQALSQLK